MNYHDRGYGDIMVARLLLSPSGNPTNDESLYDIAAFHVQQGIEKELKYILHDVFGVDENSRSFKTHNISDLIGQVENYGISVPEDIVDLAYDLKDWEAAARYSHSSVAKTGEIQDAINSYERFVDYVEEKVASEDANATKNCKLNEDTTAGDDRTGQPST